MSSVKVSNKELEKICMIFDKQTIINCYVYGYVYFTQSQLDFIIDYEKNKKVKGDTDEKIKNNK